MIEKLLTNNILINIKWVDDDNQSDPDYITWINRLKQSHRRLYYLSHKKERIWGYCEKRSKLFEPFALYMNSLNGDGFYYRHLRDDVYYLIVADGRIMAGTDCVVTRRFFNAVQNEIANKHRLKDLPIIEITDEHINAIIERCQQHQLQRKRRFQILMISLAVAGLALLVAMFLMIKFSISG